MADPYEDFIEDLAKAMGRPEMREALSGPDAPELDSGSDPIAEIDAQAEKLAAAVKKYLRRLGAGEDFVKRPPA